MNKYLYLSMLLVLFVFYDCSKKDIQRLPAIGELLPDSAKYIDRVYYSNFYNDSVYLHKQFFSGILFYLETASDKRIVNIFTGDTNFVTPEGVRIGENGVKVSQLGRLKSDGGSEYREYRLPSEWIVLLKKKVKYKMGDIFVFDNDPQKMEVITIRKYKE